MFLKGTVIVFGIILSCQGESIDCSLKTTSCHEMKTNDTYEFRFRCPQGSKIFISNNNETQIAHAVPSKLIFDYISEVVKMDEGSVTTKSCQNLTVKCIVDTPVKETCVYFAVTTEDLKAKNSDSSGFPSQRGLIAAVITVIGTVFMSGLYVWYRLRKRRNHTETFLGFITCILTCSCLATRKPSSHRENNTDQDNSLETVCSTDPEPDDTTPQPQSLNQELSSERIELTENGNTRGSNNSSPSNHRTINRNLRDEPGGINETTRSDFIGDMEAVDDQKIKDQETERRPLLSEQRAASQDFEMKGEAKALVNKGSFDPDQLSRCSIGPADVESTSNEE
ncbi:uncharacterized protein LOC121652876 isoform X2 [Melanotaenia boesemani]|uniref:uncharacterized protein LOC121652876 isoform X2 n=1 Tax=Melanotaenia boesemani TaxID=1250792 RepID=UPI001C04D342|nr:uncharacterized protein LOC121652876 isoform X2 [Melanotaenia boesemani]